MRLVTRGNLDGLTCAVLIDQAEPIREIELIHPQDITDDKYDVKKEDILANLPYHPNCSKWFDHHSATRTYEAPPKRFAGRYGLAASTARLVYDYYYHDNPGFQAHERLVDETDRYDGAKLSVDDVTKPRDYILLGFTLDPRTGLGDFRDYFLKLVDTFRDESIDAVMALPEVQERAKRIADEREKCLAFLRSRSKLHGNVVVTDLRDVDEIPVGNRFLIYTLFPDANVSVRIAWGPKREFIAVTVGHSIFNRTCTVHVGGLLAKYGGGGHRGAGATPLTTEKADELVEEIVARLNETPIAS